MSYICVKNAKYATKEQKIIKLFQGKPVPKMPPDILERALKSGVIEKISVKSEPTENKAAEPAPETKENDQGVDLDSMKKADLVKYAADNDIEIDSKAKKDEILEVIKAAEG